MLVYVLDTDKYSYQLVFWSMCSIQINIDTN